MLPKRDRWEYAILTTSFIYFFNCVVQVVFCRYPAIQVKIAFHLWYAFHEVRGKFKRKKLWKFIISNGNKYEIPELQHVYESLRALKRLLFVMQICIKFVFYELLFCVEVSFHFPIEKNIKLTAEKIIVVAFHQITINHSITFFLSLKYGFKWYNRVRSVQ